MPDLPIKLRVLDKLFFRGLDPQRMTDEHLIAHRAKRNALLASPLVRWFLTGTTPPSVLVENDAIRLDGKDFGIRVYRPRKVAGPLGLVLHFHGGGFALGSPAQSDWMNAGVADRVPAVVVSFAYPLAPEQPYPAAIEASWTFVRHMVAHASDYGADPNRIAVMGDSAGASIAAVMALRARDHRLDLRSQVLIYPVCDFTDRLMAYPSAVEHRDIPLLPLNMVLRFRQAYMTPAQYAERDATVLLHDDLTNLAPALIQTAQFDPLTDQARAYADKLRAAGNRVAMTHYDKTLHGFLAMPGLEAQAKPALAEIVRHLRAQLA